MEEQKVAVYKLEVNGREEKAISLLALKQWLVEKKLSYSALNIDPEYLGNGETADSFVAKAAITTLAEIEYVIDMHLGLIKEEPKKSEPEEQPEEKPEIEEDVSKPVEPEVLQEETKPDPKPEVDESEKSDEIVI